MSDHHFYGNMLGALQEASSWTQRALEDIQEVGEWSEAASLATDIDAAIQLLDKAASNAELLQAVKDEDVEADRLEALADASSY